MLVDTSRAFPEFSLPQYGRDASFFKSGSGEGLSELVMEFPAVQPRPKLLHKELLENYFMSWPETHYIRSIWWQRQWFPQNFLCNGQPLSYTHMHMCTHTHTHTHMHAHTHTHTHSRTHAHAHAHSQTHTHTHTQFRRCKCNVLTHGGFTLNYDVSRELSEKHWRATTKG